MEQPEEWAARVSRTVAREVRRHRAARRMSAQQLADACSRAGMEIPRTAISKIENGHRSGITVAEVLVLAAALEVPPTVLLFPVGHVAEVEYLPGRVTSPLEAADWWHGEQTAEDSALALLRRHRALEVRIRGLYRRLWEQEIAEYGAGGPEVEAAREMARELTAQLHELREEMTRRGLELPPLAGLGHQQGT